MKWLNVIDINTFNDAWQTFKTHFHKTAKLSKFYNQTLQKKPENISIKKLKKMKIENLNYNRLSKNPYPDKPRGKDDKKSIEYHLSKNSISSPIFIIKFKKKYILLDGMHRIIAAYLSKNDVCGIIVKY